MIYPAAEVNEEATTIAKNLKSISNTDQDVCGAKIYRAVKY